MVVDEEKCIGCGTCVALCPKVFDFDDKGKVKVVDQEGDTVEKIQEAIESCPVDAIGWEEEKSKK